MISIEKISKNYGNLNILRDVNIQIDYGDLFGLLGPNGAGKTTLLHIISGLINPSMGYVKFCDHSSPCKSPKIGMLFENPSFYEYLNAYENISIVARLKGYSDKKHLLALLEMVSLLNKASKTVKRYSLGMRQRLALACALVGNPDILLLDEPTNGLDPEGTYTFLSLLKEMTLEKKKIVIISSHQVLEVEQLCNKIAIINQGKIVCQGNLAELLEEKKESFLVNVHNSSDFEKCLQQNKTVKNYTLISNKSSLRDFYISTMERNRYAKSS